MRKDIVQVFAIIFTFILVVYAVSSLPISNSINGPDRSINKSDVVKRSFHAQRFNPATPDMLIHRHERNDDSFTVLVGEHYYWMDVDGGYMEIRPAINDTMISGLAIEDIVLHPKLYARYTAFDKGKFMFRGARLTCKKK